MKIKAVVKARGGGAQQWYNARQLSQLRSKCRTQYSWNLLLAGLLLHERTCAHGYLYICTCRHREFRYGFYLVDGETRSADGFPNVLKKQAPPRLYYQEIGIIPWRIRLKGRRRTPCARCWLPILPLTSASQMEHKDASCIGALMPWQRLPKLYPPIRQRYWCTFAKRVPLPKQT